MALPVERGGARESAKVFNMQRWKLTLWVAGIALVIVAQQVSAFAFSEFVAKRCC